MESVSRSANSEWFLVGLVCWSVTGWILMTRYYCYYL